MNTIFFQLSVKLAQIARKKATLDNNVKIYGVLGPICESHQPGTTKKFIETYGNFRYYILRGKSLLESWGTTFLPDVM